MALFKTLFFGIGSELLRSSYPDNVVSLLQNPNDKPKLFKGIITKKYCELGSEFYQVDNVFEIKMLSSDTQQNIIAKLNNQKFSMKFIFGGSVLLIVAGLVVPMQSILYSAITSIVGLSGAIISMVRIIDYNSEINKWNDDNISKYCDMRRNLMTIGIKGIYENYIKSQTIKGKLLTQSELKYIFDESIHEHKLKMLTCGHYGIKNKIAVLENFFDSNIMCTDYSQFVLGSILPVSVTFDSIRDELAILRDRRKLQCKLSDDDKNRSISSIKSNANLSKNIISGVRDYNIADNRETNQLHNFYGDVLIHCTDNSKTNSIELALNDHHEKLAQINEQYMDNALKIYDKTIKQIFDL